MPSLTQDPFWPGPIFSLCHQDVLQQQSQILNLNLWSSSLYTTHTAASQSYSP